MIYSGISLHCFSKKVFADDSVFASLKSLYEFQIWCALKKLWGSLRLLGRGSNFRVIIIFRIIFSSSKGGSFFTYAMHVLCTPRKPEITDFLLAEDSEKRVFRCRKSSIFSTSKINSKLYYFYGLCTPRKPEMMFFKLIFCLRKIRKKICFANQKKSYFQGLCTRTPRKPEMNVFRAHFLLAGNSGKK